MIAQIDGTGPTAEIIHRAGAPHLRIAHKDKSMVLNRKEMRRLYDEIDKRLIAMSPRPTKPAGRKQ